MFNNGLMPSNSEHKQYVPKTLLSFSLICVRWQVVCDHHGHFMRGLIRTTRGWGGALVSSSTCFASTGPEMASPALTWLQVPALPAERVETESKGSEEPTWQKKRRASSSERETLSPGSKAEGNVGRHKMSCSGFRMCTCGCTHPYTYTHAPQAPRTLPRHMHTGPYRTETSQYENLFLRGLWEQH